MKLSVINTLALIIIFCLSGCSNLRIIAEDDIVYSTKRYKWKNIRYDWNLRSPLIKNEQTILKEIDANNEATYWVYEVL